MEFNEKLQELRKRKGITQEELAKSLYVSRTAISKWESGRGYPSIDSLCAIASFFSLTLDELLSSDEALTIAREQETITRTHLRDLVFGLVDLSALLLLFLPLFAARGGEAVLATSLLALESVEPYLRIAYASLVIGTAISGTLLLALQSCEAPLWSKLKIKLSMLLGVASALLFTLSLQPYAAVFAFALLMIKALVLIRRK